MSINDPPVKTTKQQLQEDLVINSAKLGLLIFEEAAEKVLKQSPNIKLKEFIKGLNKLDLTNMKGLNL